MAIVTLESLISSTPSQPTSDKEYLVTGESGQSFIISEADLVDYVSTEGVSAYRDEETAIGDEFFINDSLAEEKYSVNAYDSKAPAPIEGKLSFLGNKLMFAPEGEAYDKKAAVQINFEAILSNKIVKDKLKEMNDYYGSKGYHPMTDEEAKKFKPDLSDKIANVINAIASLGTLKMGLFKEGGVWFYGETVGAIGKFLKLNQKKFEDDDGVKRTKTIPLNRLYLNLAYVKGEGDSKTVTLKQFIHMTSLAGYGSNVSQKGASRDVGTVKK